MIDQEILMSGAGCQATAISDDDMQVRSYPNSFGGQYQTRGYELVHEIDLSYIILPWSSRLRNGEAFREAFGDRVGYRYSQSEDRGIFWSNDPGRPIGQMARSLGLLETATEQQTRARDAQDRLRGGPAR